MSDIPEPAKKSARDKAALLVQMTKEAQRVERRTGAAACIVICFFEEGPETNKTITLQDAGRFPMPPDQLYELMIQAHQNGQMGNHVPKASRIIKPH